MTMPQFSTFKDLTVDIICHHLGTFVFRGFFMPEYCFLRRYSSKVSAFFAKFLLYFSRCTRSELLCRCHSFRLKSQDFSGLCSRRYIRAFQQSVAVNGKQSRTDCAAKFRLIGYENLCVQPLLQHFFKNVFSGR